MKIAKNTTVTMKYTLKDSEENLLETTEGVGGVTYLHGLGLMIPELENALEGKVSGESFAVSLKAGNAFGSRDEALVVKVPRSNFQDPETIEIGEDIQVHTDTSDNAAAGNGASGSIMTVVGIGDEHITLDGNHPYSGKDVVFDISILEVRETTQEDLDALRHQHHDCGHDHSGCGEDHGNQESGGCCGGCHCG